MIRSIGFLLFFQVCCALVAEPLKLVPLGVEGGVQTGNLSSYLICADSEKHCVLFDAGTLISGIQKAQVSGCLSAKQSPVEFASKQIKAVFLSHAHLDHVNGLVIGSTEFKKMPVYAPKKVLNMLLDHVFNWKIWPNLTNKGKVPQIGNLVFNNITYKKWINIPHTNFAVKAFMLSHGHGYDSTAYLLKIQGQYVLYLGDTGDDKLEKSDHLTQLWTAVAPLIDSEQLKAILIESSFENNQPDKLMFGHLRPDLILENIKEIKSLLKKPKSIEKITFYITHIKPKYKQFHNKAEQLVEKQLNVNRHDSLKFIIPKQGHCYDL